VEIAGYQAHPVKGVSIVFIVLFSISGVIHTWQNIKYNSWPIAWFNPFGCMAFVAGFICREYEAWNPENDIWSVIQGLLLAAVPVITCSLYVVLPALLPSSLSLIPLRLAHFCYMLIALTFSALITLTANGASQFFSETSDPGAVKAGRILIEISLILQLVLNIGSITTIHVFRCFSNRLLHQPKPEHNLKLRASVYILFALAITRNIFRTVQSFAPNYSPAWTDEVYFWIFDAVPMVLFAFLLNAMHPSKYFNIRNVTGKNSCKDSTEDPDSLANGSRAAGGSGDGDVETGIERKEIELRTVYSHQSH